MTNTTFFLYIEDHPASREIMAVLLTTVMGYTNFSTLDSTQDLADNIHQLNTYFDVVFLDLNLLPINGYEACTILKTLDFTKSAKIIALTANLNASAQRKMVEVGFNGMISKPISHRTFPAQVARVLAGDDVWEIEL